MINFNTFFLLKVVCGAFILDVIAGLAGLGVPLGARGPPPLQGTPPMGPVQTFTKIKSDIDALYQKNSSRGQPRAPNLRYRSAIASL